MKMKKDIPDIFTSELCLVVMWSESEAEIFDNANVRPSIVKRILMKKGKVYTNYYDFYLTDDHGTQIIPFLHMINSLWRKTVPLANNKKAYLYLADEADQLLHFKIGGRNIWTEDRFREIKEKEKAQREFYLITQQQPLDSKALLPEYFWFELERHLLKDDLYCDVSNTDLTKELLEIEKDQFIDGKIAELNNLSATLEDHELTIREKQYLQHNMAHCIDWLKREKGKPLDDMYTERLNVMIDYAKVTPSLYPDQKFIGVSTGVPYPKKQKTEEYLPYLKFLNQAGLLESFLSKMEEKDSSAKTSQQNNTEGTSNSHSIEQNQEHNFSKSHNHNSRFSQPAIAIAYQWMVATDYLDSTEIDWSVVAKKFDYQKPTSGKKIWGHFKKLWNKKDRITPPIADFSDPNYQRSKDKWGEHLGNAIDLLKQYYPDAEDSIQKGKNEVNEFQNQ